MICRKTIRLRRKKDYKRMCLWASITKGLQTYGSRLGYYRFLLRTDVITGKVSTNTLLHPNSEYANTMGNQIGREWKQMKWNEMVWISLMFRNEMPKLWIIQNLNIISQIKWFYTPFSNLFAVSFILLPNPTTDHNKIEYLFVPIQFKICHFKYDLFK